MAGRGKRQDDLGWRNAADNLEAALQRIWSEVTTKALWLDAICIDQSNSDEKSEQVQLMATICRRPRYYTGLGRMTRMLLKIRL
jgi:Heterokaryon incompatibility protein (HET)